MAKSETVPCHSARRKMFTSAQVSNGTDSHHRARYMHSKLPWDTRFKPHISRTDQFLSGVASVNLVLDQTMSNCFNRWFFFIIERTWIIYQPIVWYILRNAVVFILPIFMFRFQDFWLAHQLLPRRWADAYSGRSNLNHTEFNGSIIPSNASRFRTLIVVSYFHFLFSITNSNIIYFL